MLTSLWSGTQNRTQVILLPLDANAARVHEKIASNRFVRKVPDTEARAKKPAITVVSPLPVSIASVTVDRKE